MDFLECSFPEKGAAIPKLPAALGVANAAADSARERW